MHVDVCQRTRFQSGRDGQRIFYVMDGLAWGMKCGLDGSTGVTKRGEMVWRGAVEQR